MRVLAAEKLPGTAFKENVDISANRKDRAILEGLERPAAARFVGAGCVAEFALQFLRGPDDTEGVDRLVQTGRRPWAAFTVRAAVAGVWVGCV